MRGDPALVPQASLLASTMLDEDEVALVDCDDLESCFNIFYLPPAWRGFFVFSKKVPMSTFGGDAGTLTYFGLRCVPMGWTNSVDLLKTSFGSSFSASVVSSRTSRSTEPSPFHKMAQRSCAWTVSTPSRVFNWTGPFGHVPKLFGTKLCPENPRR